MKLTDGILEVFAGSGDFGFLVVQTRSPLIERDIETLGSGPRVAVSFTIETNRDEVRRQITPASPSVERRLTALERLTRAGLKTQAAIGPVLPCDPEIFAELVAARASTRRGRHADQRRRRRRKAKRRTRDAAIAAIARVEGDG